MCICMAKKVRKRSGRFAAIPVSGALTLATLADATVLSNSLIASLAENFFALSVDLMWVIRGVTAGEGPIQVGVSHGDYSDAEIAENLNSNLADPGDKVEQEQQRRLIRKSGMFPILSGNEALADGRAIRTRMKFLINEGKNLDIWAINRSGSALTTGAQIRADGVVYGYWR